MATMTVTNSGLNMIRDSLKGAATPLISYVALGTSSTTPAATNTQLGAEAFRKKVTSYTNGAANGEILISCYVSPSDAVGVAIAEVGVFGGSSASSTANSGVLLARGLYSHTKLNSESLQLQLDFTA